MVTWSYVTNKKRYIYTSTMPLTVKLEKVEVYSKSSLTIESFDALITWSSYHVADKNDISLLPWILMRTYYPSSNTTCWSRGHIRSHDKWKMFSIYFHVTCRCKTSQSQLAYGLSLGVTCPTTRPQIPLITWLHEFAWQMNFVISLLPWGLLLQNLTRWWLVMRSHYWFVYKWKDQGAYK